MVITNSMKAEVFVKYTNAHGMYFLLFKPFYSILFSSLSENYGGLTLDNFTV